MSSPRGKAELPRGLHFNSNSPVSLLGSAMKTLKLLFALLALIVLPVVAWAADGIPSGTYLIPPDAIPFTVDGAVAIHRIELTASPDGTGLLTIHFVKGNTIERVTYTVTRGDGPVPPPPPPPPPPPTELWGVVIEETSEQTPEQGAVLAAPAVRALFPESGFQIFDPLDAGTPVAPPDDLKPYVERAMQSRAKWPLLFLVSPAGAVYYEGALPATIDAMKTLVGQHKAKALEMGGAQ